jgi:hypothetical protein
VIPRPIAWPRPPVGATAVRGHRRPGPARPGFGLPPAVRGYDGPMSEQSNENEGTAEQGISDEQLPEDLRPTDDNPLAKAPDDEEPAKIHGTPDLGEATS